LAHWVHEWHIHFAMGGLTNPNFQAKNTL
jgi:transposase InsO family protein